MLSDKSYFLAMNLAIVCIVRKLQKNFFADREVSSLLSGKVLFYQSATSTSKVVERIGDILTDVDLSIRIDDLVNNFHGLLVSKLDSDLMLFHPVTEILTRRSVSLPPYSNLFYYEWTHKAREGIGTRKCRLTFSFPLQRFLIKSSYSILAFLIIAITSSIE